ncbi:CopG family ribbon-helix-helix protein [Halococcus sp. IIIV-5B]|uniref:CopG family ribbon-helix-helix protein n=1 Tax=Halococcus sp. IIIV-5B TaxID=2321230 RepID=UPI000E74B6BC|nr:ribbon-helix-helix protein, CopG family [Halococcus sp. IIIV-5B]RJT07863.1 ribbon-helix-helix protein, CopG family [Halococcus sp. IIIV-5B]
MRTSFSIPDELVAEFDETWQSEGLESRSRGVREAMQEYVESHVRLEAVDGDIVSIISFDYAYEPVIGALHGVQHDFQDVITTTNHIHEGEWCLETLFCRGAASRIRELVYALRDFDDVNRVNITLTHTV